MQISYTIATSLKDDSTNVIVNSLDELTKFTKFYGSNNFYIWFCQSWETLSTVLNSNKIEDLF